MKHSVCCWDSRTFNMETSGKWILLLTLFCLLSEGKVDKWCYYIHFISVYYMCFSHWSSFVKFKFDIFKLIDGLVKVLYNRPVNFDVYFPTTTRGSLLKRSRRGSLVLDLNLWHWAGCFTFSVFFFFFFFREESQEVDVCLWCDFIWMNLFCLFTLLQMATFTFRFTNGSLLKLLHHG